MKRRKSRFLVFAAVVTAITHAPAALGVSALLRALGVAYGGAIGAGLFVGGILVFVRGAMGSMPERRAHPLAWKLLSIPYFIHWCATLWTLVPALVATVLAPFIELALHLPLALPALFYGGAYVVGLFVCAYGVLVRRHWFTVREVDVPIHGLDEALDGYRIAHLSDLHIGNASPKSKGSAWAKATNAALPDLTVVTGDLVTNGDEFHGDIAEVIAELRATDGVFVSMGNHDYFGDGEALVERIVKEGGRVLRNEGVVLAERKAPLYLAAIDDTWTRRDDLDRAIEGAPAGVPTVLLAHDPQSFPDAARRGVDLVLSGHTHGGQIAMPFFARYFSLSHLAHQYHVGLYQEGRSSLYVHPGLGTTGPPMRLGVAPEVVILRLRRAASTSAVARS